MYLLYKRLSLMGFDIERTFLDIMYGALGKK